MHSILIAVPTLGLRPLPPLLVSLCKQAAQVRPLGYTVDVLVLDNSADGCLAVRRAAEANGVGYVRVPLRGYAKVRNAALDEAVEHDALVFIDDDELPADNWLRVLLRGADQHSADVVWGPVNALVPATAPRWAAGGRTLRHDMSQPDGPLLKGAAASNNTLLRISVVQKTGLRFEEDFDILGGEDTVFFSRLAAAGARIVWIGAAVVFETQDPDRLTLRGLARRAYRMGYAWALTERALQRKRDFWLILRRVARLARGVARIVFGAVLGRSSTAALGVHDLAWGCGWWIAAAGGAFSVIPQVANGRSGTCWEFLRFWSTSPACPRRSGRRRGRTRR